MTIDDDRNDVDPLLAQVRLEPNLELVHQHDDRDDPLDKAIESNANATDPEDAPSSAWLDQILAEEEMRSWTRDEGREW